MSQVTAKPEFEKLCLRADVKDRTVGLRISGVRKLVKQDIYRDAIIGIVVRKVRGAALDFSQAVHNEDIEGAARLASKRLMSASG